MYFRCLLVEKREGEKKGEGVRDVLVIFVLSFHIIVTSILISSKEVSF